MTPADKRAEQFRKIHGLVRLLGMNDDAYRDMLRDRYGVQSSKELTPQSRAALIRLLASQVSDKARNFNDLKERQKHKASPAQLRAIEAMWAGVSRARTSDARKKALNAFCERLTGVSVLAWISKADAKVLIRAIKAMGAATPEEFNSTKTTTNPQRGQDGKER